MGPAPAGGQHLGGRPAERLRARTTAPTRSRRASRPTARGPLLAEQPLLSRSFERARRRPAAAESHRQAAARRRSSGPPARPHRTSDRALPRFTEEHDGPAPDRRGAAADHPRVRRRRPSSWPTRSTTTCSRCRRTGDGCSAATRWSTSRTRSSASAASGLRAYVALLRGQQPRRRRVPAAQAGPPLGPGAVRARRVRLARAPGPAGRGVPAGAADRQRPAARLDHRRTGGSTTSASSAT